MIILSVGMPRAGSGWYYNLTHEMALAAGYADAHVIRERFHLQSILTEVNCNIGALTPRRLTAVLAPSLLGNTFVIKAHAGPTPLARRLIAWGRIRPLYIYRDPRDALLSAYELGQRGRQSDRSNAFTELTDFETALDFMQTYIRISEQWLDIPQALHTRYEDLLNAYDREAGRAAAFLGLDATQTEIAAVIDRYRPKGASADQKGLHFNKGRTGRFREKFSPEQQAQMAERFGPYLQRVGYPL